jgi:putative toxin-antitoxin system antitoxin component (TIGR02293 family)
MGKSDAARETADIATFKKAFRKKQHGQHLYVTLLGLKTFETPDLLAKIEAGLPFSTLERFQRNLELTSEEVLQFVRIPQRTFMRRREEGRLTPEESDRLLRASRLFGKALTLFEGDVATTLAWLSTRAPALADRSPLEVSATEVGAREVENLIGRLEHGVFS